jgi:hypothetical protein
MNAEHGDSFNHTFQPILPSAPGAASDETPATTSSNKGMGTHKMGTHKGWAPTRDAPTVAASDETPATTSSNKGMGAHKMGTHKGCPYGGCVG